MAIKFNCPHCEKPLTVKDELAGKKGACPNPACKKILTVPALETAAKASGSSPVKAPPKANGTVKPAAPKVAAPPPPPVPSPEDLEAEAASALVDEPKAEPQQVKEIEFQCPQCDEMVKVGMDMEGKNLPCPSCRKIIKVPLQKKRDPTDWRNVDNLPSGARRDTEPAPEGTWGTAVSRGRVSRTSLEEAGVLPSKKPKLTTAQWVKRGVLAATLLIAAGIGTLWALSERNKAKQHELMDNAVKAADGLSPEKKAAIYLAAAEYYLRTGEKDDLPRAEEYFAKARSALGSAAPSVDREKLLIELALAQIELAGSADQIEKGMRRDKDTMAKVVEQTLLNIGALEQQNNVLDAVSPRAEAARLVCRRLVERGHQDVAYALFLQNLKYPPDRPFDQAEVMAAAGLELLVAGDNRAAGDLALAALEKLDPSASTPAAAPKKLAQPSPTLIALFVALNQPDKAARLRPKPIERDSYAAAGYAQGYAIVDPREALPMFRWADSSAEQQVFVLAQMALALASKKTPDAGNLNEVLSMIKTEIQKGAKPSAWLLLRLSQIGVLAGQSDNLGAEVKDPAVEGWMQLDALRVKLAKGENADPKSVKEDTLARSLAILDVARRTDQEGDGGDPAMQPFAAAGKALRMAEKK